jgi:hypothetical protein
MQESLAPEHDSELVTNTLEQFLDAGGISDEGRAHLQSFGGDGAKGSKNIVRNPFDEVGRVLILDIVHLVLNFLHGNLSTAMTKGRLAIQTSPQPG